MAALRPAFDRRLDLDWIRIGAFGLLILYHVALCFASWDWHVKSSHATAAIEPLLMLTVPWRLALLFVVSGVATRIMAERLPAGALAAGRMRRLLPPLAFGMLVIVPPQTYHEVVQKLGYADGYAAFWLRYLSADPGFCLPKGCLVLPTWNHLWFVAYLAAYTLLLAALLALWPRALRSAAAWLESRLAAGGGAGVLLAPIAALAVARVALAGRYPPTYAFIGDWHNHANYLLVFLFGYLFVGAERVAAALERHRWEALALAAASYALSVGVWRAHASLAPAAGAGWAQHAVMAIGQWAPIVAILGFGRRWLMRDHPARRYLSEAVFPFYIVHQTAIVVLAHHLGRLGLSAPAEATALIALTAASCVASYEVVRRVGWLRPLFGLRPPATRPAPSSAPIPNP